MRRRWSAVALVFLLVCAAAVAGTPVVEPLSASDVSALLKTPARGERIVMLWSLDCVYCEPNMQALAKLQRAYPRRVELVTVSTDNVSASDRIARRLRKAGMQGYPARAYAEPAPERIDFLIDPDWGGELPRTIVIRADGSRFGISGELTPAQLQRIAPRMRASAGAISQH